ncbi:MAG: hypothetical protein Q9N34_10765, partial [Aquificota bacterium]|nr:hypothetical protein [Aquificota bacterium]
KVRDPLVTLWYISMAFLVASSVAFPFRKSSFDLFLLFLFLFGTFAQTVIMAMMYRIIPFLVWMHLSTRGVKYAPTMHQVIGRGVIWFHTGLHLFSVGTLLAFITTDFSLYSAHLPLYLLSFSLLTFNVGRGVCIYIRLSRS